MTEVVIDAHSCVEGVGDFVMPIANLTFESSDIDERNVDKGYRPFLGPVYNVAHKRTRRLFSWRSWKNQKNSRKIYEVDISMKNANRWKLPQKTAEIAWIFKLGEKEFDLVKRNGGGMRL